MTAVTARFASLIETSRRYVGFAAIGLACALAEVLVRGVEVTRWVRGDEVS